MLRYPPEDKTFLLSQDLFSTVLNYKSNCAWHIAPKIGEKRVIFRQEEKVTNWGFSDFKNPFGFKYFADIFGGGGEGGA